MLTLHPFKTFCMSGYSEDSGSALRMRLGEGVLLMQKCFSAIALKLVKITNLEQVPPTFHLMKAILVWELGNDLSFNK